MEPIKQLVADLESSNKIIQKIHTILFTSLIIVIIALIAFFVFRSIEDDHQLKQLIKEQNTIIANQNNELKNIKANQITNEQEIQRSLQYISQNLHKQDLYFQCLGNSTYCTTPTYTQDKANTKSQIKQKQTPPKSKQNNPSSQKPTTYQSILKWLGL